jgi:hypothetical protein
MHADSSDTQAEELIGTVNVWDLRRFCWPILRIFARRVVDDLELGRYLKDLLATGRWDEVRVVPHRNADGSLSDHVFDTYGRPVDRANATRQPRAATRPDQYNR